MEAKELMAGDWVSYRGIVNRVAPADFSYKEWIDEIKPIPLTREILEKIGFVEKEFYSELIVGDYRIICDLHNVCIQRNGHVVLDAPIEYLHELQHAFRLCKIDKEIKL